jgi:predicted helicase
VSLSPDADHTWIVPERADEYRQLLAMDEMFAIKTLGLNTNRDEVVYDFNPVVLASRLTQLVVAYNIEVDRHRHDKNAGFTDNITWSSRLKE